jgi:hypothetical protein
MDDNLCFVQFIHPGGEHEPDDGVIKNWNRDDHWHHLRGTELIGNLGQWLPGINIILEHIHECCFGALQHGSVFL